MREPETSSGKRARSSRHDPPPRTVHEVYARHSGFVWRVARRMGIPEAAVEDVMHEVFLVVHRRLPEFDGRVAITTWLYHQTRGVVSNYRRGRLREQRRLSLVDAAPAPAPDPEAQAGRGEAAEFVRRFLDELDDAKREVFVLVELEGLAVPEVAQMTGLELNTAYSRLRAARKRFQRAVQRLRASDDRSSGRSRTA